MSPVGRTALALALVVAACGAPVLANPPLDYPLPPLASARPAAPADPVPIVFPRDDGPHDRLTEWWYYTGHLATKEPRRFGFEAVVFRAERGSAPPAWASHLALTDEAGHRFMYAQRSEVGPQVDRSPRDAGFATGFDLRVAGLSPDLIARGAAPFAPAPWRLSGAGGHDAIEAALTPDESTAAGAALGLRLELLATKAPALHDGDGFVDFGPAGSSYYYSRTRMKAAGEVTLDGERSSVEGIAWFDHQWGDFISVGGGWDWFAINLDDGTDLTISRVLDDRGEVALLYGTLVPREGQVMGLDASAVSLESLATWVSPHTARSYPQRWRLRLPGEGLTIVLTPTVEDQELDTRPTTGVAYWEGSQVVSWTRDGAAGGSGEAYVEITRYGT